MLIAGLVSVSFRGLTPEEIIKLAGEARLRSIEWGSDVHVPAGGLGRAAEIRRRCTDAEMLISAYGSYYRVGGPISGGVTFEVVLDTAVALGSDTIRVWAGNVAAEDADQVLRGAVLGDLQRICRLAGAAGVTVALEHHAGTLSDSAAAALSLIADVKERNLSTFWQPPHGLSREKALRELRQLLPHVQNLHVFHWWPDPLHRQPLVAGAERWRDYLRAVVGRGRVCHASLEFVRDDSIGQFLEDAATLHALLAEVAAI